MEDYSDLIVCAPCAVGALLWIVALLKLRGRRKQSADPEIRWEKIEERKIPAPNHKYADVEPVGAQKPRKDPVSLDDLSDRRPNCPNCGSTNLQVVVPRGERFVNSFFDLVIEPMAELLALILDLFDLAGTPAPRTNRKSKSHQSLQRRPARCSNCQHELFIYELADGTTWVQSLDS